MVDWRQLTLVLAWALAATLAALAISSRLGEPSPSLSDPTRPQTRIVSLSPAITESLFAIGAAHQAPAN